MGQTKAERTWPQPRDTRHVWVFSEVHYVPPVQGLVVAWTRRKYRWSALVVFVEEGREGKDNRTVQEWVPLERLRPVRTDPNKIWDYAGFGELLRPRGTRG